MRELHAIGLSPDGQHLVLAASPDATKGSHRIAVDQRFEAVLRGQKVDDPASGPSLSVQDMQARLRSGATVEEVAAAAGLPVPRVERFAGPILSEREAVLVKVFAAHQVARRGRSHAPLSRAVAIGLEGVANVKLDTVDWTAYRKADGTWVARVSVFARGRVRRAEWALDDAKGTVRPLDAWSGSLGHLDAVTKPAKQAAPAVPAKAAPARATLAKGVAVRSAPAKATVSRGRAAAVAKLPAKPAKTGTVAKPPAKPAKVAATPKAPTRVAKTATTAAKPAKAPAKKAAPLKAVSEKAAPAKATSSRSRVAAAKVPVKPAKAVKVAPKAATPRVPAAAKAATPRVPAAAKAATPRVGVAAKRGRAARGA